MSTRPENHLNLGYLPQMANTQSKSGNSTDNNSPMEPPPGLPRSPFGPPGAVGTLANGSNNPRLGAGSPSHDLGGRLYSKRSVPRAMSKTLIDFLRRAREIQAQEGLATPLAWGPPPSGGSTPLRETILESPVQDGFPDLVAPSDGTAIQQLPVRRGRAGTLPSRFSPGLPMTTLQLPPTSASKTSRPTPSTSPFRPLSAVTAASDGSAEGKQQLPSPTTSALLQRLRAGSLPQRANPAANHAFGSSLFSSGWNSGRDRSSTLASIRSSDGLDSPSQSSHSRDGLADSDVKTLDYLGLAETPQPGQASLAQGQLNSMSAMHSANMLQPFLADLATFNKNMNRYRSYSVNAKEKYAADEAEEYGAYSGLPSGAMTPQAASAAAALAATQAQIHQHNLAVQAFANQASVSRPRARTAGILDSPLRNPVRGFLATPSRLENSMSVADYTRDMNELQGLPEAIRAMHLNGLGTLPSSDAAEENGLEGPTRALWLGSIPTSTTVSSLQAIFGTFGKIESTRVLVQKNCGFVNFEEVEAAMMAKATLNGKEIFPGAGPVRIGYAKAPSLSTTGTPGNYGTYPSPSPDPHVKASEPRGERVSPERVNENRKHADVHAESAAAALHVPDMPDLREEMLRIVKQFGAEDSDMPTITASIDAAIAFDRFETQIPPVPEPSHTRVHDAPKLREIRKRIDNNAMSQPEIEEIAMGMLPEIAELASDYLGNTVVQKLFEYCSEPVKESMLAKVAPHLAEIGVHKNGTWAAQKIIDVAKSAAQIQMIVDNLRPYTVALFLDQYGNYVLQCCLRFGYPWNNFIFETMLSKLWDTAQGRFGARAMRACLESHHSTKDQQRMLASAIALHSVQLATNANGALLLTWFLDTCTFPQRRTVLAPLLIPHLVHLCTHKVAYLTVLKVINQRNEPEARDAVLKALFFSPQDKTLEDILSDQACGATLIFKILTTPFFDEDMRNDVTQNVRTVLIRLKVAPSQGYKRLMDEVGLASRVGSKSERDGPHSNSSSPYPDRSRSLSQQGARSGHIQQSPMGRHDSAQFSPPMSGYGLPSGLDGSILSPYEQFAVNSPMFTPTSIGPQQLAYQQALMQASSQPLPPTPLYGGYTPSSATFDGFRQAQPSPMGRQPSLSSSPMMPTAGYPPPPGFPPMMSGGMVPNYGGYPMPFYPPQQIPPQAGGRRGRVSESHEWQRQ